MDTKFSIPCCNHELPALHPLRDVQVLGKVTITGISQSIFRRLMVSVGEVTNTIAASGRKSVRGLLEGEDEDLVTGQRNVQRPEGYFDP
jgi:hypothetical protein